MSNFFYLQTTIVKLNWENSSTKKVSKFSSKVFKTELWPGITEYSAGIFQLFCNKIPPEFTKRQNFHEILYIIIYTPFKRSRRVLTLFVVFDFDQKYIWRKTWSTEKNFRFLRDFHFWSFSKKVEKFRRIIPEYWAEFRLLVIPLKNLSKRSFEWCINYHVKN